MDGKAQMFTTQGKQRRLFTLFHGPRLAVPGWDIITRDLVVEQAELPGRG